MLPQILLIRTVRHTPSLRLEDWFIVTRGHYLWQRLVRPLCCSINVHFAKLRCKFGQELLPLSWLAEPFAFMNWSPKSCWFNQSLQCEYCWNQSDYYLFFFFWQKVSHALPLWFHILFPWGRTPAFISLLNNFLHDWRTMNKVTNIFFFVSNPEGSCKGHACITRKRETDQLFKNKIAMIFNVFSFVKNIDNYFIL